MASTAAAHGRQPYGGPRLSRSLPRQAVAHRVWEALGAEAVGYIAMLAFLAAYGLMVAEVAPVLQGMLNLLGCGAAVCYLARKKALPNVICNIIWAVITLVGLIAG